MAVSTNVLFIFNVEDQNGRFLDCVTFYAMPARSDRLTDQSGNLLEVQYIDHRGEGEDPVVIAQIIRRAGARGIR